MELQLIKNLYQLNKIDQLQHRYITNAHLEPLINTLKTYFKVAVIGKSVLQANIYGITVGQGAKRILLWSQMHGNESTTTKALSDLLFTFVNNKKELSTVLEACTLYIIPILNPDGAQAYTRVNANLVDLNRDAQNLTQLESVVLKTAFDNFKPHFCYNLHGQRTIFSAGNTNNPATVSFLAPSQDEACTITANRKIAMEIIAKIDVMLQKIIPNQVGRFDDAFNLNCVGDAFQSQNVPTLLFEAGHFPNDYAREQTRELIYISYITSLNYIATTTITGENYANYFQIPENNKLFYDVIIKNTQINGELCDIGVLFQEQLREGKVTFIPKVETIGDLSMFYGHRTILANTCEILKENGKNIGIGDELFYFLIKNTKIDIL